MTNSSVYEQISGILAELARVRLRPEMFFGRDNIVIKAEAFLSGFGSATKAVGIMYGPDLNLDVIYSAGWSYPPDGVARVMRDTGLSDMEIVAELIDLEIRKWGHLLSSLG